MEAVMRDEGYGDKLQLYQKHRQWEDDDITPQQDSPEASYHHRRSHNGSHGGSHNGSHAGSETPPPPSLSSPSIISSAGLSPRLSPFKPEPSPSRASTLADDSSHHVPSAKRIALARRLSLMAQQLAGDDDGLDELALSSQVDQMEKAMLARAAPAPYRPSPQSPQSPRRSFDLRSLASSPSSPRSRSRFSDLSSELLRRPSQELKRSDEPEPKAGMTPRQARRIVAEVTKLNDELAAAVANLKARQEESDHIHGLLLERAERAAQRILFLQSRISYLEQELQDNDQELQHLRICLKAVELQMPPHPDSELQRCIVSFKDDYLALKQKRASRQSASSIASLDSSLIGASPTR